eukprot:3550697-Alexandrium_andersonii.AAC.1
MPRRQLPTPTLPFKSKRRTGSASPTLTRAGPLTCLIPCLGAEGDGVVECGGATGAAQKKLPAGACSLRSCS